MMHRERASGFLSTSIPKLDFILKGGLPPCTVTEVTNCYRGQLYQIILLVYVLVVQISGPPGSGKTQFCMMLSVQSALPIMMGGCGRPVIYIDTEGAFSAERYTTCDCDCWLTSTSTGCNMHVHVAQQAVTRPYIQAY